MKDRKEVVKRPNDQPVISDEAPKPKLPLEPKRIQPDPEIGRTNDIPPPRRAGNHPPEGFASDWVRVGKVQTRVVGSAVTRPVLVDLKGREFLSSEPALLIWVEARGVEAGAGQLRRWIGALESAASLSSDGTILSPVRFPAAVAVGQLDRATKLGPTDPAVVDVLAFAVPESGAQSLSLKLAGSHVGETGAFTHVIPASAWKK
ncbi:hypothetical protein [Gemmata massiliana]|nr:hypothetical protein [Gemmata massiliana]